MVPKMILRLGFVDLVDLIANSMLTQLVALSELSEPSGRARPWFGFHTYRFLNASCKQCVVKNDCI